MATEWYWDSFSLNSGIWSGSTLDMSATRYTPQGNSLQRLIVSGGFSEGLVITGSQSGRKQAALPIVCSYEIDKITNGAVERWMLRRHFELLRTGEWSQNITGPSDVAVGFMWSTPPGVFDFDADVRASSAGSNGVRITVSMSQIGQGTDGLVGLAGQISGLLFAQVLYSVRS